MSVITTRDLSEQTGYPLHKIQRLWRLGILNGYATMLNGRIIFNQKDVGKVKKKIEDWSFKHPIGGKKNGK